MKKIIYCSFIILLIACTSTKKEDTAEIEEQILNSQYASIIYNPKIISYEDISYTAEVFDAIANRLEREFNHNPIEPITIRIFSNTQEFTYNTSSQWWESAISYANIIEMQPPKVLKKRGILASTLAHEYTHILINEITQDYCPIWLNEGLAVYHSGEIEILLSNSNTNLISFNSLSQLNQTFRNISQQDMDLALSAYITAYHIVAWNYKTYGKSKLHILLDNLGKGQSIEQAIKDYAGISYSEFEQKVLSNI